nr:maltotransferase domain-containing protein [Nocardioides ungokensis]
MQAWSDPVATWQHAAGLKIPAGVDVDLMFVEGRLLLERVKADLDRSDRRGHEILDGAIEAAADEKRPVGARLAALQAPELDAVLLANPLRELVTVEGPYPATPTARAAVRQLVRVLPRSEGATRDAVTGKVTSGNFRTAAKRLDAVASMGFDVIYLPPIHPIARSTARAPTHTLTPGPDDTGSPWAIGSKDGGHDAIHPDLGTFEDFDAFVAHARGLGLEVALDLALQAAPDHPWVTSHPEWFTTRADGTIAYAENPPKKYQDIYPVNFDNDPTGICREVLRVVRMWMSHGVRIFRVDNPHTKPVAFWEWLLKEIRRTDPDVLFLAEAFTRPAMMQGLGAIGFQQSYTYFTWRNAKWELEEYLRELATETDHLMRPNFFVNTRHPARLPAVRRAWRVQDPGGRGGDRIAQLGRVRRLRALRARGGQARERGVPRLGEVPDPDPGLGRRGARGPHPGAVPHPPQRDPARAPRAAVLRNVHIHHSDDENILVFSKRAAGPAGGEDDVVIVVVNLDPHATRETMVHLDLPALGLAWDDSFVVHDEITREDWSWGQHNYVRLDPSYEPAHILTVRSPR